MGLEDSLKNNILQLELRHFSGKIEDGDFIEPVNAYDDWCI